MKQDSKYNRFGAQATLKCTYFHDDGTVFPKGTVVEILTDGDWFPSCRLSDGTYLCVNIGGLRPVAKPAEDMPSMLDLKGPEPDPELGKMFIAPPAPPPCCFSPDPAPEPAYVSAEDILECVAKAIDRWRERSAT